MANESHTNNKQHASDEQLRYANVLSIGVRAAFVLMVITFVIYLFNIIPPEVPTSELVHQLQKPADEYRAVAGIPQGWGWVELLPASDYLNYLGIILLSGLTLVALLTLLPAYIKSKNFTYVAIIGVEIIVILTAASGILNVE